MHEDRRGTEEIELIRAAAGGWPPAHRLAFTWQRIAIASWLAIGINLVLWIVDVRGGIDFSVAVYVPWLAFLAFDVVGRRVIRNEILPKRSALGRRAIALETGLAVLVATPYVLITGIGGRAEFYVLAFGLGIVAILTRPATSWVDFLTAARQEGDARNVAAREQTAPDAQRSAPTEPYPSDRGDLAFLAIIATILTAVTYAFLPYEPEDGPLARAAIPALLLVGAAFGLWRGLLKVRRLEADRLAEARLAGGDGAVGRYPARAERRAAVLDVLPTGLGVASAVARAVVVLGIGALVVEADVGGPELPWIGTGVVFLVDRAICGVVRRRRRVAGPPPQWSSPAVARAARELQAAEPGSLVLVATIAVGIVGAAWWLIDAGGLAATHPVVLVLAAAVAGVAAAESFADVGATSRSEPPPLGDPPE